MRARSPYRSPALAVGVVLALAVAPNLGLAFLATNTDDTDSRRYTTHAGITRTALDLAFANGALVEVQRESWGPVVVRGAVWEDTQGLVKPPFYRVRLHEGAVVEEMHFLGKVLDMTSPPSVLQHALGLHTKPHSLQWNVLSFVNHFYHRYAANPYLELDHDARRALVRSLLQREKAWPETAEESLKDRLTDSVLALAPSTIPSGTGREYAQQLFAEAVSTYNSGNKLKAYHLLGRVAHVFEDQATILHAALIPHLGNRLVVTETGEPLELFWSRMPYDASPEGYGGSLPRTLHEVADIGSGLDSLNERMLEIGGLYPGIFGEPGKNALERQLMSKAPPRTVMQNTISASAAKDIVRRSVPLATSYVAGVFRLFEQTVGAGALSTSSSICIVLDSSGSMAGDRIAAARQAAASVLGFIEGADKVAVVSFSSVEATIASLGPLKDESARLALIEDIRQVQPQGGTDYALGLTAAFDILETDHAAQSRAILFLSDGKPQNEGYWSIADRLAQEGIPILAVGLGSNADDTVLKELARRTGGSFLPASSDNLIQVFAQLSGRAESMSEIVVRRGVIRQFQRLAQTLKVGDSNSLGFNQMRVALSWTGSNLGLTLVSPSGTSVSASTSSTASSARFISDAANNYKLVTIDKPAAGEWQVVVEGLDVPSTGEMYTLTVSGSSKWVTRPLSMQPAYQRGQQVSLGVVAAPLAGLEVASAKALVVGPGDVLVTINLGVNGQGGERASHYGEFSAPFTQTTEIGLYHVRYMVTGKEGAQTITRLLESSFQVGDDPAVLLAENRDAGLHFGGVPDHLDIPVRQLTEPIVKTIELGRNIDSAAITDLRLIVTNSSQPDLDGKIYNYRFREADVAGYTRMTLELTVLPELLPASGKYESLLRISAITGHGRESGADFKLTVLR
jgi:Mg-chelatase subunit ChlD